MAIQYSFFFLNETKSKDVNLVAPEFWVCNYTFSVVKQVVYGSLCAAKLHTKVNGKTQIDPTSCVFTETHVNDNK